MRMQIERDKELMSKKFEKLQKSKNVPTFHKISDLDSDVHGPLQRVLKSVPAHL